MWSTMVWNGGLDVEAGDGKSEQTAIPIITKNDDIRPVISRLWKDSHWQLNKNMVPRLGSALGDVGIKIADDPDKEAVTMDVVHPGSIRWVRKDRWGNVKAYLLEEWRIDPEAHKDQYMDLVNSQYASPVCLYSEWCYRDGDGAVVLRTYRNGVEYDWDGNGSVRQFDYGFVPFVIINHKRTGPRDYWGWSEPHAGMTKFMESDDVASKLNDQIRKVVEGAWFISGAQQENRRRDRAAQQGVSETEQTPDDDRDRGIAPGRDSMKIVWGGMGATATPLLFPLDIQFTTLHLDWLAKVFEKDYPELQFDSERVSGDASAKALRETRKKAVTKFNDGRVAYDEALVRAQQMAIAIGGWRGYSGYEKFNLESFKAGKLDHRVGHRPVFEVDTLDRLEESQAFWTAAQTATTAGCPLQVFLAENGWTDAKIQDYLKARQTEDDRQTKLNTPADNGATPKGTKPANPQTAQSNP
jgi:hypothetical protein